MTPFKKPCSANCVAINQYLTWKYNKWKMYSNGRYYSLVDLYLMPHIILNSSWKARKSTIWPSKYFGFKLWIFLIICILASLSKENQNILKILIFTQKSSLIVIMNLIVYLGQMTSWIHQHMLHLNRNLIRRRSRSWRTTPGPEWMPTQRLYKTIWFSDVRT